MLSTVIKTIIKVVSIGLVSGVLSLELGSLVLGISVPLPPLALWFARFVLIAHGIEAIAAVILAPDRGQRSLPYGIYVFFVGTVGLTELLETNLWPQR
ncbi:MAG: hypothetical protein AAF651_07465 [Cyanobacteria bacterium P01_C01_bin.73]